MPDASGLFAPLNPFLFKARSIRQSQLLGLSIATAAKQTQTHVSRDSANSESPGTPSNADLLSMAPALLRRSPGVAAVQPAKVATLICLSPTLAASASDAAQTELDLQLFFSLQWL
ncbi:hypothetical protein ABBQ32_005833 [Trebouxia sp. C0010 RCD-2024]